MSNLTHNRSHSQRFSREGFTRLPNQEQGNMAYSNNDATIDIPLEQVASNGQGLRQASSTGMEAVETNTSPTVKRSMFRGRRQRPEFTRTTKTGKYGYDGEEDEVNTMGKIYKKVMNFSVFTRYLLYVIPVAAVIAVPIIIDVLAPKGSGARIGNVRVFWFFTWVEMIWLSLWGSKVIAHYLPYFFRVLAGVVSSGVRKYSQVIGKLEIQLSLVGWAVTSLATFKPLMTKNPDYQDWCDTRKCDQTWINVVQNILAAATIASVIYLAEKFIIQLISINYHRKQFNARIKDSKRNIWILGLLYDASRALFPMYCNEFAEEDYIIADQLNLSRGVEGKKSNRKSGSHTPMRIIQDIGHAADKVTSAFGNIASEVTGKNVFNPNSAHSIVVEALEKNRTSEALARRIWMSLVVEGRDSLTQEDIMDVLGPARQIEAEEAFWTIDQDGNGDISLDEMILTVTEYARERKSIANSMHDVDQAINVLDQMLAVVVLVIVVLVFVGFLNPDFTTTLATTGTALLSLSFVFAASAQEVLGSCIFLFVKHPFDIGDIVDIATSGCANPEHFAVEHISLLFCVFRRIQGGNVGQLCQIPNIVLNTLWIQNISRSKALTEQLTIDIAYETTFDDLQILKNELLTFITDKDNSRDYQPSIDIDVLGTTDQSKLSLLVEIKHKSNWSNESVRRARRSKFMCALVSALKVVPIYPPGGGVDVAGSAALPTYSVAISHQEAKEHADEAAQGREEARLVSNKKVQETKDRLSPITSKNTAFGAGMNAHQQNIAENLTNRDPTRDPARDDIGDTWGRDDSSTLGERPSMDRNDEAEIRGLLRRESTRGKRKPSSEAYRPTIPTINEPTPSQPYSSYPRYPQQAVDGHENQRPSYSTIPAPYLPPVIPSTSPVYQPPVSPVNSPVEMSQIPSRTTSNPYRSQNNNNNRRQLSPNIEADKEDEFNLRPYSGV